MMGHTKAEWVWGEMNDLAWDPRILTYSCKTKHPKT